jgi:hypothetical protein
MAAGLALGQPFSRSVAGGGAAPPPFDPTQIAGLQAWYDTSDNSTYTFSSGSSVSQHRDKSGQLHHQNQNTVASQPFRDGVRNGLPTNRYLGGRHTRYLGTTNINVGACTIFMVMVQGTDANYLGIMSIHATGTQAEGADNASLLIQTALNTDYVNVSRMSSSANILGSGAFPYGLYSCMFRVDGSTDAWKDSVKTPGTVPQATTYGAADGGIILGERLYLGALSGSPYNGELAEIVIYNTELSAINFAKVELYLRTKWATPPPPPPPTLTSLTPNNCIVNVATTVTLTGTNFLPTSVAYADTTALTTTYVSATSLTASFTPTVVATSQFTVRNGVDISNQVPFTTNATPPFAPTDIPNLKGWWDSNDASSFVYSSGTEVSQWSDKSGFGWHMTQSTVGLQPSRSGTENSKPTIVYDSSVGDFLATAIGSIVPTNPYTLYLAFRPYLHASYQTALMDSNDLTRPGLYGDTTNTFFNSFGGSFVWPVNAADGVAVVYAFVVAPNPNGAFYRNGTLVVSANHSSWGLQFGLKTGKTAAQEIWRSFFTSYFEILAYAGAHTTTQRQQVEAYLKSKWGTP